MIAGRSSVLREMLEVSTERKDDKVVLKLEVDVAIQVMDIFFNFLYTGKLKDVRENELSVEPTWVEMLPDLVAHADKVSDLLQVF